MVGDVKNVTHAGYGRTNRVFDSDFVHQVECVYVVFVVNFVYLSKRHLLITLRTDFAASEICRDVEQHRVHLTVQLRKVRPVVTSSSLNVTNGSERLLRSETGRSDHQSSMPTLPSNRANTVLT